VATQPQPGETLAGKYRIERVLGEGGMGLVVQATHLALDQQVAIKFLKDEALEHPEVVERFKREARAAVRVRGPHVARVIDVDQTPDGKPFMVMEYMNGEDLDAVLEKRGALTVEEAATYVLQACDAIAEAHAQKIIHRDIKPANLFLTSSEGRKPMVKVLDFGISKLQEGQGGMTQTAAILGSPYYMSPEQLRASKNVDERADIWSLGVTLYELLTGKRPFQAETLPEIVTHIVLNQPPTVRSIRPDVPEELEAIVLRCMRTKPEERYQNVAELARALAPFAEPGSRHIAPGISRMLLGASLPPAAGPAPVEMTARQSEPPPAGPPAASAAVTIASSAQDAEGSRGGERGRASDLVAARKGGRGVAWAGGAVLAIVAIGGAAYALRGTGAPATAGPVPTEPSSTTASTVPPSSPVPPPSAHPVASQAPSAAPQVPPSAATTTPPHGTTKTASPVTTRTASAPASASARVTATAATIATPPSATTPPTASKQPPQNPLQMGLK
jgi:serine/threonine-protein kinase